MTLKFAYFGFLCYNIWPLGDIMSNNKMTEKDAIIAKRLQDMIKTGDFTFEIEYLKEIHKYLFSDVLDTAGTFRTTNISKPEIILNGESVKYVNYYDIIPYLAYDFNEYRASLSKPSNKKLNSLTNFTSGIWQVHPFMDGNTRTVLAFILQYLNKLGYDNLENVYNDYRFYFRNALVIANYSDYKSGIVGDTRYLIDFFQKLLLKDDFELNRDVFDQNSAKKLVRVYK